VQETRLINDTREKIQTPTNIMQGRNIFNTDYFIALSISSIIL